MKVKELRKQLDYFSDDDKIFISETKKIKPNMNKCIYYEVNKFTSRTEEGSCYIEISKE